MPHRGHILNLKSRRQFSILGVKRLACFLQATRSSGSLHISFKLSPVHSFTSPNHCLAGLPRHLFPSTLPCKMVFVRVPFALIIRHNRLIFLFLVISSSVSYLPMSSATLFHVGRITLRICYVMHLQSRNELFLQVYVESP